MKKYAFNAIKTVSVGLILLGASAVSVSDQIVTKRIGSKSDIGWVFSRGRQNSMHYARKVQKGNMVSVVYDGVSGPEVDWVESMSFDHGDNLTYLAGRAGRRYMVVNNKLGPDFDDIYGVSVSPDNKHVVYEGGNNDLRYLVIDGVCSDGYSSSLEDSVVFSPDSQTVACIVRREGKYQVLMNGILGPLCDGIVDNTIVFSDDSKRVAYSMFNKGICYVVIDGVLYVAHRQNVTPVFSPDSKRVAYIGSQNNDACVVVDGLAGRAYPEIRGDSIVFSPDGKRVAYEVRASSGARCVVVDGVISQEYDRRNPFEFPVIIFSSNSKRVAWIGKKDFLMSAVIDGVEGPYYDGVNGVAFSPDGSRVAYVASVKGKETVIVDGIAGPRFDDIKESKVVFSNSGEHFAYTATKGDNDMMVVDAITKSECDEISFGPVFDPTNNSVMYISTKNYMDSIVWDGMSTIPIEHQYEAVYSPDKTRFVLIIHTKNGCALVDKGKVGPFYDEIQHTTFSSDSKRLAYMVSKGGKSYMVVDGIPGPLIDKIGMDNPLQIYDEGKSSVVFSPDNKHISYVAWKDNRSFMVLDKYAGPTYTGVVVGGPAFRTDGGIEYFALQGNDLFHVSHIPGGNGNQNVVISSKPVGKKLGVTKPKH